jgi:hypothetical protein
MEERQLASQYPPAKGKYGLKPSPLPFSFLSFFFIFEMGLTM